MVLAVGKQGRTPPTSLQEGRYVGPESTPLQPIDTTAVWTPKNQSSYHHLLVLVAPTELPIALGFALEKGKT